MIRKSHSNRLKKTSREIQMYGNEMRTFFSLDFFLEKTKYFFGCLSFLTLGSLLDSEAWMIDRPIPAIWSH